MGTRAWILGFLGLAALLLFLREFGQARRELPRTQPVAREHEPAAGATLEAAPKLPDAALAEPAPAARASMATPSSRAMVSATGVHGRVLDDRGEPFAGASVQLERRGDPSPTYALSCPLGSFELEEFEPGTYECVASWKSLRSSPTEIELVHGSTLELVLARPARLVGRVITPSGEPDPRARIVATTYRRDGHHERLETVRNCDDAGRFELDDVTPGEVLVQGRSDEHTPSDGTRLWLEPGEVRELELRLQRASSLTGEVFDGRDLPVADAQVRLESAGFSTRTDRSGGFVFADVPPGRHALVWVLEPGDPPRRDVRAEAVVAEGERVHVRLGGPGCDAPGLALRGRVLRRGTPVADAWVSLRGENAGLATKATTGPAGEFALELAQIGMVNLALTPVGEATTIFSCEFHPEQELVLEVPGGVIAGLVLRADGLPWSGARIELRSRTPWEESYSSGERQVSDDGSFRFASVAGGSYLVSVSAGRSRSDDAPVQEDLELSADEHVELTLVQPASARLTGVVRTESGTLMPSATLRAVGPRNRVVLVTASSEARYELRGLGPGPWSVVASAGELVSARQELTFAPGEERVLELVLASAPELLVRAVDESGAPVRANVSVTDALDRPAAFVELGDEADAKLRQHLPAGEYRVQAMAVDFPAHADTRVRLVETAVARVVLVLSRPASGER